jgi:spore coat polysaccharide biosynthesis predicted glycosyltransferase SpsG
MSGCRLLVVDDYQHLERYSADLILNQNIDARDDVYQTLAPGIPVLAGLNFVLLRREFCNALPSVDNASVTLQSCENQDRRESVHLLITLGGTDLQDLSTLILAAIEPLVESYSLQVRLLKGADNQKRSAWESMEPKPGWLNVLADVSEMVPQYRWADLAIVGGGSSNWELCCFGIPRLVIVLAENQVAIARGLERAGVAINLGDCRELTSTKFSQALIQLLENSAARQTQSRRSRGLVDGQGAKRVVNYLLGMAATSKSVRQTQLAENVSGINLNRRQT